MPFVIWGSSPLATTRGKVRGSGGDRKMRLDAWADHMGFDRNDINRGIFHRGTRPSRLLPDLQEAITGNMRMRHYNILEEEARNNGA
jgi:hypothetical protein